MRRLPITLVSFLGIALWLLAANTAGGEPGTTGTATVVAMQETPTPTSTPTATVEPTATSTVEPTATTVPTPFTVSINNGALFTNSTDVILNFTAPADTTQMLVSNDGGFGGAVWEPFVPTKAWSLASYGSYVIPRTVYVRFRSQAGALSEQCSDDIILDPIPPTGNAYVEEPGGQ